MLSTKKYSILAAVFICILIFCQAAFSENINVKPKLFIIDVQSTGTATIKILNHQNDPINGIPVTAKSNNEDIAAVVPNIGLTDPNGQILFTVIGVSNGTTTVAFDTNILSDSVPVTVVSNIAPCAKASSSGGGTDRFGPEVMNDGIEEADCSYHWVRTRKEFGQKKIGWIRLDWDKDVTISRMLIQTTGCNGSCGEDSDSPFYIDPGRNIGNGIVQYLDRNGSQWIRDGEFTEETGNVEYSFSDLITTRTLLIKKILPSSKCKGQQSNPVIFEWKVYGTPACK